MLVSVRFFASAREAAGRETATLELPSGATLSLLRTALGEQYPQMEAVLARSRLAVNRAYVDDSHALSEGDQVVVVPPVAGGAAEAATPLFEVTDAPIDAGSVLQRVMDSGSGGIVVFHGVVRNRANSGRAVQYLEYEAFFEMAVEQMRQIASEACSRWPVTAIAMTHRTGRLVVGDTAVVIAVAAVHRAEAFAACQYCIDRLKEIVPIWKRETGPDGSVWVE
jgi:molybdopterin converting factor subunit 1